jgi:hypothetical protein
MVKKLMLLAMAVGALVAFAAPAMAQANVTLTNEAGEALESGEGITATGSDLETVTAAGTLFCNEVNLSGEVGSNGGATATAENISGTATFDGSPACPVLVGGEPVTQAVITNISASVAFAGGGNGTASFSFTYDLFVSPTEAIMCTFATSSPAAITYTTGPPAVVTVPGAALTGTGELGCPSTGTLHGHLTLGDASGSPLTIDD